MRKLAITSVFVFVASLTFIGCAGEEVPPCNCPDIAPWSAPGSDNCYADPSLCASEEGQVCELCN